MEKIYEVKEDAERVILFAASTDSEESTKESLEELSDLVKTAGAITLGTLIQNRDTLSPGTYIGKGKIDELRIMVEELGATGVVCDDELSPAQLKNLEDLLNTKVMDRTLIILEIFASRAKTREGKIQVELAQLKYRSARLVGLRSSLSRLGGGIGTKGPGEKKLEMDRRLISDRMSQLRQEVKDIESHRELARSQRQKNMIPVIAIVGYTNAGKSTLLNTLTDAGVLEEDKLFATLDPTTRNYKLPSGQEVLLTDTVGFIRKLPHHLIDAFRSTLEESKYADIIIHVVDSSNPQMDSQMSIVYETLENLKVEDKTIITLFNKQDKLEQVPILRDFKADYTIPASIKTKKGLDELVNTIEKILQDKKIYIKTTYLFNEAGKIQLIRKYGQLLKEEYQEDGIYVEAYIPIEIYDKCASANQ